VRQARLRFLVGLVTSEHQLGVKARKGNSRCPLLVASRLDLPLRCRQHTYLKLLRACESDDSSGEVNRVTWRSGSA
jgi:hypothetical protein